MVLCHVVAAGDPRVGSALRQSGAIRTVHQILNGTSPLPHSKTTLARLIENGTSLSDLVARDHQTAQRLEARFCIPGDREWPRQLEDLGDRQPIGLWLQGEANLRLLALRSVAMVGARAATSYGELVARTIAGELTARGWLVVSGGAFGIDAAAHRGALGAGGATVCVLAGGVDVPYPRSHEAMLGRIAREGLLISETPLGGAAQRQRFLTRNRVIAALTRATIVVEAALRSGSRTTAREAGELLRPVMAIPGPITSPMSAGCHELVRDARAVLVTGTDEIVELVGGFEESTARTPELDADIKETDPRARRVLGVLSGQGAAPLEVLARSAGLSPTDALVALGILEARGAVRRTDCGWIKEA
jgi:DNA processing protein